MFPAGQVPVTVTGQVPVTVSQDGRMPVTVTGQVPVTVCQDGRGVLPTGQVPETVVKPAVRHTTTKAPTGPKFLILRNIF